MEIELERETKGEEGDYALLPFITQEYDSEEELQSKPMLSTLKRRGESKKDRNGFYRIIPWIGFGLIGWVVGNYSHNFDGSWWGSRKSSFDRCDPYSMLGYLNVNLTSSAQNYWQPFSKTPCPAIDYLSAFTSETTEPILEFFRDKTVVILDDSVGRGNFDATCDFLKGRMETIGSSHEWSNSASLPEGFEKPKAGYDNPGKENEWANFEKSRPHICTVDHLNFKIVQIFIYGFAQGRPGDDIYNRHHFFPPLDIEDRVEQVLKPILVNLSAPIPDLISISPTFWDLFRFVVADDQEKERLQADGVEDLDFLDSERTWDVERQEMLKGRMEEVLLHLKSAWKEEVKLKGLTEPTIIFRALHNIKYQHTIPSQNIALVDSLGPSVVKSINEKLPPNPILIDNWGHLIRGQEQARFADAIHPLPIPCGWLYGNKLLDQLRRVIESRGS